MILTRNKDRIAIEIKSGSRIRPEDFAGLEAIAAVKGVKRRIMLYQGTEVRNKDGIEIIPVQKFIDDDAINHLWPMK